MPALPIAAFLCCLSLICVTSESRAAVRMADEVLHQASRQGFDYKRHIEAAASRDEAATRELFIFSRHTDAAGSIGHGVALVDLFQTIGEEMSARVAATLSSGDRKRLKRILEAGVSYGFLTGPEEFPKRYPGIAAAVRPARFSPGVLLVSGVCITVVALLIARRRLGSK